MIRSSAPSWNGRLETEGLPALLTELQTIAPTAYERVDRANHRRVIRAIERARVDGDVPPPAPEGYPAPVTWLGMTPGPDHLDVIESRVRDQFRDGLLDEAAGLRDRYGEQPVPFGAMGYREAFDVLSGRRTLESAILRDIERTRSYASRQRTWFRSEPDIHWIMPGTRGSRGSARDRRTRHGTWVRPGHGTGRRSDMRSGIVINAGDARQQTELASRAEGAGWDGVFTWDGVAIGDTEIYDPWALLGAMAIATTRVTLGAIVFAPTRRRPWKLAREATTVDHLSAGRLVLPVGLGALDDQAFGNVGETTGVRERAAILDETLAILDGLWAGEPFGFQGEHYRFEPMTFLPRPVQRPRIPVWVVGVAAGERSLARATRWDGLVLQTDDPDEIRDLSDRARLARQAAGVAAPFQVVAQGTTPVDATAAARDVQPIADAGVTWWIEADWSTVTLDTLRARIDAGPPRVS